MVRPFSSKRRLSSIDGADSDSSVSVAAVELSLLVSLDVCFDMRNKVVERKKKLMDGGVHVDGCGCYAELEMPLP